jgi:hypothetical protein
MLDPPSEELSWRIPEESEAQRQRIGVMQVAIATLFFAAMVLGLAPRELILPALAVTFVVAGLLLWRNERKYGPRRVRPPNVRLAARGVAWFDAQGQEHLFARERIEAFRVAQAEDTLRPVPALVLALAGGFESQPIELHEPATPANVRQLLGGRLGVPEQSAGDVAERAAAAAMPGVALREDAAEGLWEFSGPRENLLALCDRLAEIAEKLASFPAGARPLALRLGESDLHFAPSPAAAAEVAPASFRGTRNDLAALAASLAAQLEREAPAASIEAPVFADAPEAWQVRFVVRPECL